MTEITEERTSTDRVIHLSPDALTGLPGRGSWTGSLAEALTSTGPGVERVVVMFLDVDDFYIVNDSFGHSAGDELLATIADRLQETVGPKGVVGHFGGDLFTVVCSHMPDDRSTTQMAEQLIAVVARPVRLSQGEVFVTASVGISVSQGCDDTTDALLRNADVALHQAKEQGSGRAVLFDAGRHNRAVQHLHTRSEMQRAIERGEFLLHFQPVVSLQTGRAVSFEALVRWQHPERGLLLPQEFISHAEQSGVINRLGAWVLEEACRRMVLWGVPAWQDAQWRMSVNLSPQQLAEPSFPAMLTSILQRTGMRPDLLALEITETTLMLDAESATSALGALRELGIHIAVDDFGTGYSCLAYLKALPVDTLKIDRYFVEGIGSDRKSTAICAAIIRLAEALELGTIAEGVETARQLAGLRALGCQFGQGHLFGRAQPAETYGRAYDWTCAPLADADAWAATPAVIA